MGYGCNCVNADIYQSIIARGKVVNQLMDINAIVDVHTTKAIDKIADLSGGGY